VVEVDGLHLDIGTVINCRVERVRERLDIVVGVLVENNGSSLVVEKRCSGVEAERGRVLGPFLYFGV
jgi:hypothetical protein